MKDADSGEPLPTDTRAKMERAFDADFSDVRVHQGSEAPAMGALAYTRGSHIHFAPGRYAPDTQAGQERLGHELAHVVQQRAGRVAAPGGPGAPINADAGLEREAEQAGARAAAGQPAGITGGGGGGGAGDVVQRAVGFEF